MAKKQTVNKKNTEYHRAVRRNQFIFGIVAVLIILSMALSLVQY